MIKINDIKKEENDNYFITYIKDGEILTYSGNKEIVKEVTKNFKKGNKND
jgi:hypothetical protein